MIVKTVHTVVTSIFRKSGTTAALPQNTLSLAVVAGVHVVVTCPCRLAETVKSLFRTNFRSYPEE